jgi:hypothetical protein
MLHSAIWLFHGVYSMGFWFGMVQAKEATGCRKLQCFSSASAEWRSIFEAYHRRLVDREMIQDGPWDQSTRGIRGDHIDYSA